MKHGSLFSGIGGFELAAEWMGWDNVFHCEWNEFGKKVLKYYWPNAVSYDDITKTDFTIHRGGIDILTGGFPCQPYSMAGKRLGKEDDRHLWPEMLRTIREVQPRWVVGENVFGLINWNGGLVFHEIQADLEAEGYEVWPYVLPAVSVNAPHRRDRVWFVAHRNSNGQHGSNGKYEKHTGKRGFDALCNIEQGSKYGDVANTKGLRSDRAEEHENNNRQGGEWWGRDVDNACKIQERNNASHTKSKQSERVQSEQREISQQEQRQPGGDYSGLGNGNAPNPTFTGRGEECQPAAKPGEQERQHRKAHSGSGPIGWEWFPTTQPTIRTGNDGFSSRLDSNTFSKWRNESIKAAGNAIVPQVVFQIFKAIEAYERL